MRSPSPGDREEKTTEDKVAYLDYSTALVTLSPRVVPPAPRDLTEPSCDLESDAGKQG